ncbi:MAG: N-acetyltransferase [Candidatus Aenigmarchaeota archaeon]|nr:N-acetyltransferase [Candidatus Aenigmarchaeota archaeon]
MQPQIHHKEGEFFIEVNGKKAVLDYTISGKKMDVFHTFTDPELRGQGLAEQLAQAAFDYAKSKGLKIVPTCDYVRDSFLKKHPEWNSIVEHW